MARYKIYKRHVVASHKIKGILLKKWSILSSLTFIFEGSACFVDWLKASIHKTQQIFYQICKQITHFLRVFCSMNAKSKLKEVKEYPKKLRTASLQPSRINQSVWCSSPLHSDLQSRYSAVQHTCHVFVVGFNEHERSCWYSDSERSSAHANNAFLSAELKPVWIQGSNKG